jgi:cytochrome c oxidase assembly protein subunit 15
VAYIGAMASLAVPTQSRRAIGYWLIACAAMVFVMVMLGGATRLTESGLSMVHWKPFSVLPPLTEMQWQQAFHDYQQYPEFIKKNSWMELADFKQIYWLEFTHRLWGRLIGVVFFVPFLWFVARRVVDRPLALRLGVLFVLGGLQGALGWYMVSSGLESRPDVSQYRLAAHLVSAFILYAFIVWLALDQFRAARGETPAPATPGLVRLGFIVPAATLVTVAAGAFVAGLDAGKVYNTFPLMDGGFTPPDAMIMHPWYMNFFENIGTVQFDHRVLAMSLVALVLGTWAYARRKPLTPRGRVFMNALGAMVLIQAALGITTLLLVVPIPVALAHQTGALILFTLGICFAHEAAGVREAGVPLALALKPAE